MASNKNLSATITIGGAVSSSLKSAFGSIKGQVNQVGSALRDLERQQRKLGEGIQTFGRMGKDVDGMRQRYTLLTQQIDKLRAAYQRLNQVQKAQEANLARRAELRGQIFDAVALGATAASPIVKAAQFETAMLGVAKQVDGARDSTGKLTGVYFDMAKQIQMLGREIPIATNQLADMVAAGARMGVAKDELIGFTRTAAMMADAFELPAGELADNMGKIAGLFKIPIPAISQLADSINYLDDNAISKGGDIIDFLTRTGGVAASVKITGQEMAALGSTLLTLGERAETASTATNAMFSKFAAADKGTKKFKAAMKQIGLSTAAVQKGMQKDATGTLIKVMEAVSKLPKEQQLGVLVDLVGLEHSDTLAKLVNNTAEFRKQLELANSEAAKGSMSREFQARLQTTNAQWIIMKNVVEELAVNIGSVLLPAVNGIFKAITPVVNVMAEFARNNPKLTQAIVGTAVALTTLKLSTLAAGYAFTFMRGGVLSVIGLFARMQARAALGAQTLAVAASAVTGALTSIGKALLWIANPMNLLRAGSAALTAGFRAVVGGVSTATGAVIAFGRAAAVAAMTGVRALGASLLAFAASPVSMTVAGLKSVGSAMLAFARGGVMAAVSAVRALSLAVVSNPIGLALAAIAAAGALIYAHWDGVKAFMVGTLEGIRSGLQPLVATFSALWEALKPLHPTFDAIGTGLKSVWQWFTNLIEPVQYTSTELGKAGEAGRSFGEALAAGINFVLTPLTALINGITWVANNIDTITDKAVSFKNAVGNGIGNAWQGTKNFFGFGDDAPAPKTPGPASSLPSPSMATGRGGSNSYQDNSQNTYQIVQQPGEDQRGLAKRIAEEQERQRRVRERSMMTDGVIAQ